MARFVKFSYTECMLAFVCMCTLTHGDDYSSITSDIFGSLLLNVWPFIHQLSNAVCRMVIDGFCPIIFYNHLCLHICIPSCMHVYVFVCVCVMYCICVCLCVF